VLHNLRACLRLIIIAVLIVQTAPARAGCDGPSGRSHGSDASVMTLASDAEGTRVGETGHDHRSMGASCGWSACQSIPVTAAELGPPRSSPAPGHPSRPDAMPGSRGPDVEQRPPIL
jgi:hypothetical protein